MSQFPSVPPPGAYVPPNQNQNNPPAQGFNQQQQQPHYGGYQQQQQQTPSPYGPPAASHKPANTFGQAFNQAMTTGKPMLNKLGKTISSKLGSKPAHNTPQHLESYQNYQQHQQQHQQQAQQPSYQNQGQHFNPQPAPQQQQQQSTYTTPQQSPFPQPSYGTPASGNSGQSNYFAQQAPQTPNPQPQQQSNTAPGYNPGVFGAQGGSVGLQSQEQPMYGQIDQSQPQSRPQHTPFGQAEPARPPQQTQSEHYSGQQTGVVGGHAQSQNMSPQSPQMPSGFPETAQPGTLQEQWASPAPGPNQAASPPPQQSQTASPALPPQQHSAAPPPQQFGTAPPVPVHPNQQQQQWTPTSPASPQQGEFQPIPPVSPPPPHLSSHQQSAQVVPAEHQPQQQQQQPQQHQPPTPTSQKVAPQASPTAFVAELPADMESSKPERPPSTSSYQAYRPVGTQGASPRAGFTVPRRAVSTSSLPLADPWRFADPATELPTREFFIIADLIFDTLDRKFEPQNTGLVEASKLLESWKVQDFAEEAAHLFMYDSYAAFAKLWTLEGVPHLMVPCEPALAPRWNFQQQSHVQELKIPSGPALPNPTKATYIPALNRAGFYKYIFLAAVHDPESLEKILTSLCLDAYKPGILNQPDLQRRDKTPISGLAAQAAAIQTAAVSRVCEEMAVVIQGAQSQQTQSNSGAALGHPAGGVTQEEMMLKMHNLKLQQQANNTMGGTGFSTAAGNLYTSKPNYGGLV